MEPLAIIGVDDSRVRVALRALCGGKRPETMVLNDDDRVTSRRCFMELAINLHRIDRLAGRVVISVGRAIAEVIQLDEDEGLAWLQPARFEPLRGVQAVGVIVPPAHDAWWSSKPGALRIDAFATLLASLRREGVDEIKRERSTIPGDGSV